MSSHEEIDKSAEPVTNVDFTSSLPPIFGRGQVIFLVGLAGFSYWRGGSPVVPVTALAVIALLFWLSKRLTLIAVAQGLIIQNWIKRHDLSWAEIEQAYVVSISKHNFRTVVRLRNGEIIKLHALTRNVSAEPDIQLFGLVMITDTINTWAQQQREGKLVELSYDPSPRPELQAKMDALLALDDEYNALFTSEEIDDDSGDTEWSMGPEEEAKAEALRERMFAAQQEVSDLVFTYTRSPNGAEPAKNSAIADGLMLAGKVAGFLSIIPVALALAFGPLGATIDARVVAHEGSDPMSLNTVVEFDPGSGLGRYEIGRIDDAPPYTPIGETVRVSYFKLFPALVSETDGVGPVSTSIAAGIGLAITGTCLGLAQLLRRRL
ncbi:MAG: hypothetical protein RL441_806 [Actinomycetota bacterium]|jgi:hypothetical protein